MRSQENMKVPGTLRNQGTDQEKTGKYTGASCLTIVAEDDGVGASKWGLLKAYENELHMKKMLGF